MKDVGDSCCIGGLGFVWRSKGDCCDRVSLKFTHMCGVCPVGVRTWTKTVRIVLAGLGSVTSGQIHRSVCLTRPSPLGRHHFLGHPHIQYHF